MVVSYFHVPDYFERIETLDTEHGKIFVQNDRVHEREIERLIEILKCTDIQILKRTFVSLKEIGEPALQPLIETLENSTNDQLRRNVALALGEFTEHKNVVFEVLKKAIKTAHSYVRSGIVIALGELGDKRSIPLLVKAIKDPDTSVSHLAARALVEIGDSQSVEPLIGLLTYKKAYIRANAAYALGLLKDIRAIEPLIEILQNDSDEFVRAEGAASSLGYLKDTRAVEPLILALKDESSRVRFFSAIALGWLKDSRAIPALQWAFENDKGEIRLGDSTVKDAAKDSIEKIKQANL